MYEIKSTISAKLNELIQFELNGQKSPIFVFVGLDSYIDSNLFSANIVDKDTFAINGNESTFNQTWFTNVFTALQKADKSYYILSFPQFSYLIHYINVDFFTGRIIIIRDNLRMIYPISKEDFLLYNNNKLFVEERRPDNMPEYMSELFCFGSKYYYSINGHLDNFASIRLFNDIKKPLNQASDNIEYAVIDIVNDQYGLDVFLNDCLNERDFHKKVLVKVHIKHPQDNSTELMLQEFNGLLHLFGGEVYKYIEQPIEERYVPSDETYVLLKKYWGKSAEFRNLRVYKNPDVEKSVISISQGKIVETIIDEYKNAKKGIAPKDLFLTAPTGAGKSLLFQLPAFYVSEHKDVTIVISPLIALMKDQVSQIWSERGYRKVQYINGELSIIDRDRVIEECKNGEIDILYMAPELLLSYDISFFLGERKLGLMVIDEAHLITTWGRDFRVDYWFLGQHISKIRKYNDYSFPMVAVTATAIYGGDNDMVFDSITSLNMNDPHMYIGEVKRNDITFIIDNHDKYGQNYDSEKEKETVRFVENIDKLGIKTIVYTPYTRQIDKLQQRLANDKCSDIAVSYHGGLNPDAKELAYTRFRTSDARIMISTKAFGMGVDISDIQLVYHHAPSGLLPDYIQEIGRAARKTEIRGFAALTYAAEDQRYSKILYGMSSLKVFQIREVIKKIYSTFEGNNKKRNMLLSVSDFGYIFDNSVDLDQKVMTALMMIEKDYLAKYRFNVLVARPKKLFVHVFAKTNLFGYRILSKKYPDFFEVISNKNDSYVLLLNLDEIWKKNFSDQSFPRIKHEFYCGKLFEDDQIEITPMVKITMTLNYDYQQISNTLNNVLTSLKQCFVQIGGNYFSEDDLKKIVETKINTTISSDKIIKFILNTFSSNSLYGGNGGDDDAFLQRRRSVNQKNEYRVINKQYNRSFATLLKLFSKMFDNGIIEANRYVTIGGSLLTSYIRLGSLLEILGLANYQNRGGDNPMIFVRINDPLRIKRDSVDNKYSNVLLNKTNLRHKSSSELFDHFFLHTFENEQRWSFIEDYFLGASNDELLNTYPGGEPNHIDIIKYLERNASNIEANQPIDTRLNNALAIFPPKDGDCYDSNRLLTIDNKTLKISKWIMEDPVALDKVLRQHELYMMEDYKILQSRLMHNYFEYYRDIHGLKLWIDFPGYDQPVAASIPYTDTPIKFYKWWKTKEKCVTLNLKEKITLFLKVEELSPGTLIKRHQAILNNKTNKK